MGATHRPPPPRSAYTGPPGWSRDSILFLHPPSFAQTLDEQPAANRTNEPVGDDAPPVAAAPTAVSPGPPRPPMCPEGPRAAIGLSGWADEGTDTGGRRGGVQGAVSSSGTEWVGS
jgi:hypothetical protein